LSAILSAFGDSLGRIPLIGGLLWGFFRWLGTIVSALFDVFATIIRGGVGDFFSGISGAVVAVLGKLIAFSQAVFLCSWGKGR
jgi:hypothetical protein